MKLELLSLRLVGAGPLKDVTLDFSDGEGNARPVTLIAGANGSGKTTVLEAIFWLMDGVYNAYNDVGRLPIRYMSASTSFKIDVGKLPIRFSSAGMSFKVGEEEFMLNVAETRLLTVEGNSGELHEFFHEVGTSQKDVVDGFVRSEPTDYPPSVLFFSHIRSISAPQGKSINREDVGYEWTYRYAPEEDSSRFRRFKGSLDSYLIWLEYAEPDAFARAQNFIKELYDYKKRIEIDRSRLKAVVVTKEGGRHDINYLSSGEQNLLIILLELQRRLTPHSIVLIDEIENSLHPKYQHRLGQALKTLQTQTPFQLIATSHAPAFMDIFGAENTLILTEF